MDKKKTFNLIVFFMPWLTVLYMKKQAFFRFLPVAIFISFFLSAFSTIANKKKWWKTKSPLYSKIPIDLTYILGPFFVGTLWVFKQTFGNFPKYMLTNLVLNFLSSFPLIYISEKAGVLKFKRMKRTTWYIATMFMAVLFMDFST
ncbi:MAG TPA: hypothetical protein VEY70_04315 [Metabacillus sp.]|nr:hypothetical protein [Metabacillus sp.]